MNLQLQQSLPELQRDIGDIGLLDSRLSQLFNVREHGQEERGEVEAFIRECFAAVHNSRITHFMPRLLSLRSRHGERIAAFGLRPALQQPLFLETYLNRPIEQVLQTRLGLPVQRDEIIEVGNLSALYPGAARWLIVAVTAILHREGYKWVTFTGTASLRNGFHRLGLRPIELGKASPERLPEHERGNWGSYYDQNPMVMVGDIGHGFHSLLVQRDLADLLRGSIASVEQGLRA